MTSSLNAFFAAAATLSKPYDTWIKLYQAKLLL